MPNAALRLGGLLGFGLSAFLIAYSARISWADWISRDRTRPSILAAIRLFPDNSLYYRFWAEIEPADAVTALRQGAAVNPLNYSIRMELATAYERAGNLAAAESSLLDAVSLNRTFIPLESLADFYTRHPNAPKFWPVARQALQLGATQYNSLYQDCWTLSTDPALILQRAIPHTPLSLATYLAFLLSTDRIAAAAPAASLLMAATPSPASSESLLAYCDRLIPAHPAEALAVWNWLCSRKLLPYAPLDPPSARSITNSNLAIPAISRAFDWRLSAPPGVFIDPPQPPLGLTFTFTGKQPESCALFNQFIPLIPTRTYLLHVDYSTTGISGPSGLAVQISLPGGPDLLHADLPAATLTQHLTAPFTAPPRASLANLQFLYRRALGTVRIEGSASIHSVSLTFAQ